MSQREDTVSVFELTDAAFCLTTGLYKAKRGKSVTPICIMRGNFCDGHLQCLEFELSSEAKAKLEI